MKLSDLTPSLINPRKISDEKLEMLKKSLDQFGELNCIVFNRQNGTLVSGHQRLKVLPPGEQITITKEYDEPNDKGTIAEGFIEVDGERFKYREVVWDEPTHKAGLIAANKHGGQWDLPLLTDSLNDLDALNIDMDLLGFDKKELEDLMTNDKPKKKQKICPHCGKDI